MNLLSIYEYIKYMVDYSNIEKQNSVYTCI